MKPSSMLTYAVVTQFVDKLEIKELADGTHLDVFHHGFPLNNIDLRHSQLGSDDLTRLLRVRLELIRARWWWMRFCMMRET